MRLSAAVRLIAGILVVCGIITAASPAKADVTITFRNDGANLKMTYSGSITGTPTLTLGRSFLADAGAFYFAVYNSIGGGITSSPAAFPVSCSPCQDLFTTTEYLFTTTGSGTNFAFYPGEGFAVPSGWVSGGTISGEVTFENASIDTLASQIGTEYQLTGTTGGTGGTPDKVIVRVIDGDPETSVETSETDIRRIIQQQAQMRLTALMADNGRMMKDARDRFMETDADGSGFEATGFSVDGDLHASGGSQTVITAASSGSFSGQSGLRNGVNLRVSGNFNLLKDDDNELGTVDARIARETFLGPDLLWGTFAGGQLSNSDIVDTFNGSETASNLYLGTYGVTKLSGRLFADAYASVGYGWNNLSMENEELSLESDYGAATWQLGGSLTGVYEMRKLSLRPSLSLAHGNSQIGEIGLRATVDDLSSDVSFDAGDVTLTELRFTPEMRLPMADGSTTIRLLPSLICQRVGSAEDDDDCGIGGGAEFVSTGENGAGRFTGRVVVESVGGVNRVGGQLGYAIPF